MIPIYVERSSTSLTPRNLAVSSVMRQVDLHCHEEVGLNIEIRVSGVIRTITVTREGTNDD